MGTIAGVIQYRGKLGNTVGMKGQNGKHFLRLQSDNIKNPRSEAQNIQRMILSTVAAGISPLTNVLRTSVEGKQAGAQTLAYLRGQWMRMLRTSDILQGNGYSYLKKGEQHMAPNPYMISKGRLVAPRVEVLSADDMSAVIYNGVDLDEGIEGLSFSEIFPNIRLGDQLTFIAVADRGTGNVAYCRVAFKTNDVPAFDNGRINPAAIDETKAEGDWENLIFSTAFVGGQTRVGVTIPAELFPGYEFDYLAAFGLIVSNLESNQRSTSYLAVAQDVAQFPWSAAEAAPTYGNLSTSIDTASDVYLNNSTTPVPARYANVTITGVENDDATISENGTTADGLPRYALVGAGGTQAYINLSSAVPAMFRSLSNPECAEFGQGLSDTQICVMIRNNGTTNLLIAGRAVAEIQVTANSEG